jgi:hypothetical protein
MGIKFAYLVLNTEATADALKRIYKCYAHFACGVGFLIINADGWAT